MPVSTPTNLWKNKLHPVFQGGILLVISFLAMLITTKVDLGEHFQWYIAATAILLYTTANPIIGIFKSDWRIYLLYSVVVFALVVFGEIVMANWIAAENIGDLVQFRLIFIAEVIFYLMINFLVVLFQCIVNLLKTMDT